MNRFSLSIIKENRTRVERKWKNPQCQQYFYKCLQPISQHSDLIQRNSRKTSVDQELEGNHDDIQEIQKKFRIKAFISRRMISCLNRRQIDYVECEPSSSARRLVRTSNDIICRMFYRLKKKRHLSSLLLKYEQLGDLKVFRIRITSTTLELFWGENHHENVECIN